MPQNEGAIGNLGERVLQAVQTANEQGKPFNNWSELGNELGCSAGDAKDAAFELRGQGRLNFEPRRPWTMTVV